MATASAAEVAALRRAVEIARELARREGQKKFEHLFPDETHDWMGARYYARSLYERHLEAITATARYKEVAVMAGNRVGKTVLGGYCLAVWLTGRYPEWWTGRRFPGPIRAWAAGDSYETVRDILQPVLFGGVTFEGNARHLDGTGTIPGEALGRVTWRSQPPGVVDTVAVRHVSGGVSTLGLKSYEQGRKSFQGTSVHVGWVDEEPPLDVYGELVVRTATTQGLILATFTPLSGLSDVAKMFMTSEAA